MHLMLHTCNVTTETKFISSKPTAPKHSHSCSCDRGGDEATETCFTEKKSCVLKHYNQLSPSVREGGGCHGSCCHVLVVKHNRHKPGAITSD